MLFVLRSHEKIISCKIGLKVSEEMFGEDISIFCYEDIRLEPVYVIDIQIIIMNKIISRMIFTLHVSRQ